MSGASSEEKDLQAEQAQQVQMEIGQQQTQYAQSQDLFNVLKPQLESIINNPTGFSAEELANLNASNVNTTGAQYANIQKQLNLANSSENMAGLTSGVAVGESAALKSSAAGTVASNASNIQLSSAQLAEQKKQAATTELMALQSGQGGMAINIGNTENTAEKNSFDQANTIQQQSSQLMNGILGGLLNKGIGMGEDFLTGGFSSMAQGNSFGEGGVSGMFG